MVSHYIIEEYRIRVWEEECRRQSLDAQFRNLIIFTSQRLFFVY